MTGNSHRFTTLTLTLLCVGALGACKPKDRADTAAARTDSAAGRLDSTTNAKMDSTHAMAGDSTHRTATGGAWTNDRIFGYTHNANNGEIALGKLAEKKATNPQVKAFAREMVKDHTAMMNETHALFSKLNVKPDSAADDARDLAKDGADKLKELTDKAAGADWDKNYIENQVDTHQKVLDKLNDVAKNSTDSTVTKALTKATAKVQEHLTKAQNLKNTVTNK
jgi:putative membrane protein